MRAALGGLLLGLLLPPEVLAGGGPCGVVVVYDPTDPSAVTVANHYQQVRGIPERNMIPYVFPAAFTHRTGWDFIYGLRSELATRGLTDQLQAVALAGISPRLSGQTDGPQGNIFSTQSFLYQSPNYSEASFPENIQRALNLAYPEDAEFYALPPAGTRELSARTSFQGRRYLPCSYIGYTGKNGNRVSELFEILSRAKAHDGIKPRGTIYWPLNSDLRSATREAQLDVVAPVWDARGIAYVVTGGRWDPDNAWVRNRPDILGGIVGQSNAGAPEGIRGGNTYRAGAWIDHLTSFGGLLDNYVIPLGQMSAAKWLRAGADGSAGAVAEPLGWPAKFPAAHLHTHLRAGASLAEAFWQSVRTTAEVACLGDPLLQPFADFPRVTVTSPSDGARVTGSVAIVVRATPTGGKVLEPQCDLWVDGRRWANDGDPASAGASRTTDGFSLDTKALPDGWHELRVVAYNHDGVRTQGEAKLAVTVHNRGQWLGLTGPSTVDPDGEATFILTPVGLGDLVSLVLRANGRTLATAPLAGGEVKVRLSDSGSFAPLGGNWSLFAMGTLANGQQVSSAPFTTAIAWPATAASSNPRLGAAAAEVRYFASIATPGFHWDTSTPDLVTTLPGDREQGIGLATNHVFGLVLDYAAKPGFQLDFWFYAPVEDLYEIGHDFCEPVWSNPTGIYTEQRACFLDGRALVERDYVYPPRHLAPGWHSVRLRLAFNDPRWATWKARLRGGMNEDFGVFQPGWTANLGTGAPSSGPAFVAITPTNLVTGATRTLSARAFLGDGTAADPASLTCLWTQLAGPAPVTFSPDEAAGLPDTTVVFTEAGHYTIGLRVAGPANSAFGSVSLTVTQTAAGVWLSTGSLSNALQGLPFDLFACTLDQFGKRMEVTGTEASRPTFDWSSTDPGGAFTLLCASGESAQFRSLAAVSQEPTAVVMARGINGRSGSASATLIVRTNTAPRPKDDLLFYVAQPGSGQPLQLTANVTNLEQASGLWHRPMSAFRWSVVSAPPGQTLSLHPAEGYPGAAAGFSGPGTYEVRLDVTDPAGATCSQTQTVIVDAAGAATFLRALETPANGSGYPGDWVYFGIDPPGGEPAAYQWQKSSDGGASWEDLPGATDTDTNYGPLSAADNGELVRIRRTTPVGTLSSPPATLTVDDPAGGAIGLVLPRGSPLIEVPESAGGWSATVRRSGGTRGAVSVTWFASGGGEQTILESGAILSRGGTNYSGTLFWGDGEAGDRVLTFPVVDDSLPEGDTDFILTISAPPGGTNGGVIAHSRFAWIRIIDDDNPGKAAFVTNRVMVRESDGRAILPVRRSGCFRGRLTVAYTTRDGTAIANQDYAPAGGSVVWEDGDRADKLIVIPILGDRIIEEEESFQVNLIAPSSGRLSFLTNATVAVQDAPYQRWQQDWWPSLAPVAPVYRAWPAALAHLSPQFVFRCGESGGDTLGASRGDGEVVFRAALVGPVDSYTLAAVGPRPPAWPGFENANTALALRGGGVSGAPAAFTRGACANGGTALGFGTNLGQGFTLTAFVNTTVTNCLMTLLGGLNAEAAGTALLLSLNQSATDTRVVSPDHLRVFLRSEANRTFDYSVPLRGLPTGSVTDGRWHHLAVTVPSFAAGQGGGNLPYPHFYFDGAEANGLEVRGDGNLSSEDAFADFVHGFRVGAGGGAAADTFFSGAIDELAVFDRVLSATEIDRLAHAGPPVPLPDELGDGANPSGDGIPNLVKYAFGLNPLAWVTDGRPAGSLKSGTFTFEFTRRREATDITYRLVSASEWPGRSWTEIWNSSDHIYPGLAPASLEAVPLGMAGEPERFFRLLITRP